MMCDLRILLSQVPASTGPRYFERGNDVMSLVIAFAIGASTGPRYFERGNMLELSEFIVTLQRGRATSSAEI